MNLQSFATDRNAENEGKWFEMEDARFLIGASGNLRHRKAIQKAEKRNRLAVQKRDQAVIEAITIEITVDGLLYGWENVKEGETDLPFTRANAIRVLTQYRMVRDWIMDQALTPANFSTEEAGAERNDIKSGSPVAPGVGEPAGLP